MLLRELIDLSVGVELAAAAIYDHFATQFAANTELSTFWRLSAEAERYHAATIRIHAASAPADREVDSEKLPLEVEEARKLLARLDALLTDLAIHPRSIAESLELATALESEGAEIHGRTQFAYLYPELAELFTRLADEDREHRKSFALAKAKFAEKA